MKAEELAVIKERAEKASAGPWFVSDGKDVATEVFYRGYSHSDVDVVAFSDGRINAEFIANARQDVPKLVAEVERLQRKLAQMCSKDVPYMIRNFGEESYYEWRDSIRREALE